MSNEPEKTGILENPELIITEITLSNPDLISIAVTSIRGHIIALTLIFPKLTIPLSIFSSSLKSSEVSSRASTDHPYLYSNVVDLNFFLTNDEDMISKDVTGLKSFSRKVRG